MQVFIELPNSERDVIEAHLNDTVSDIKNKIELNGEMYDLFLSGDKFVNASEQLCTDCCLEVRLNEKGLAIMELRERGIEIDKYTKLQDYDLDDVKLIETLIKAGVEYDDSIDEFLLNGGCAKSTHLFLHLYKTDYEFSCVMTMALEFEAGEVAKCVFDHVDDIERMKKIVNIDNDCTDTSPLQDIDYVNGMFDFFVEKFGVKYMLDILINDIDLVTRYKGQKNYLDLWMREDSVEDKLVLFKGEFFNYCINWGEDWINGPDITPNYFLTCLYSLIQDREKFLDYIDERIQDKEQFLIYRDKEMQETHYKDRVALIRKHVDKFME